MFLKRIYHQFQVGVQLQHILRTDDLKKTPFYTVLLLWWINANKCGQYCFQILQVIGLPCQPNPTSVLDYLIFSHLQTQKWKCTGIWATLFSSRTRIVGTVHRLSHIGLLTKICYRKNSPLHGKALFGRPVSYIWENIGKSFLKDFRKDSFLLQLSFFSFFFKVSFAD